jgi:transcription elongation factor Elf1
MELRFNCPHCGRTEADPWEALEPACVHVVRCDGCNEHYYLALIDCAHCEHESVFTFRNRPSVSVMATLRCTRCSQPLADDERSYPAPETQALA